jgi:hypothetical protein
VAVAYKQLGKNKTTNTNSNKPSKVKAFTKGALKGGGKFLADIFFNAALDKANSTSIYYDPATNTYVNNSSRRDIWRRSISENSGWGLPWLTNGLFEDLPAWAGNTVGYGTSKILKHMGTPEYIADAAGDIASAFTNAGTYSIPFYGAGRLIDDLGESIYGSIYDYNRDIDMIKDIRYGDLGYSNDYILKNSDLWNLYTLPWHGIDSLITRFKQDSDWSKLGRQTVTKILQKQLEDTNNFDMEDAAYKYKSLSLKNDFDKFSQLLADEQKYWELVALKDNLNMDDEQFAEHLSNNGIDQNRFNQLEYSAKQIHNLGDNQARNGFEFDPNYKINTWDPKIQLIDAQKKRSMPEPSVKAVANIEPTPKLISSNDLGYIKGDPMTFTKEYNKRHGIRDVTDFYDIWK